MSKFYPTVMSFSCVLLLTPPCYGISDSETPATMDDIVVSASRFEEKKKEVPANITIITNEQIEQSPSNNLAELLTEKGFGHIQKYPGALTSIGIRGFRSDSHGNDLKGHVLILLDGRRAGTGNAVKLLTQNIERVEIIRGPGAVQYGSAGMGGIINVITKQGHLNSMFIEAGAGSYSTLESSIGGTAKSGNFDFAGAVTALRSDDYETGAGQDYHNTGIERELGASLNFGYSITDKQRIGIIFTGYDVEDAGSPGYLSQNDLDDSNDKRNFSLDAQYSGISEDRKFRWMGRMFTGKDENSWKDPVASNPDRWDNGIASTNETDQLGAQLQGSIDVHNLTFTGGFDWVDYRIENSWSPQETSYSNPALFFLGKARFLDDTLITTAGIRYDWYEVEVAQPSGREEDDSNYTPQLGLAWQAIDNLTFRAQYAEGFMIPSADELAMDTISFGTRVIGNPNLSPEESKTYEAGIDIQHKSFQGSFTYFHTDFENKIVSSYLPDGSKSWKNLGDATIAGIEAEFGYDLGEPLGIEWEIRPFLNVTYLTEYEDEKSGENLLYVNETSLSAGLSVNNYSGFSALFNIAHYSSQDVRDYESGTYPAEIISLDDFTIADLSMAYTFLESPSYGKFSIKGNLRNLFDEDYAFVKGYPMAGRNFLLSLRWEF